MSLPNQSEVFLAVTPTVKALSNEKLHSVDFDNASIIESIIITELTDLLIKFPGTTLQVMKQCGKGLMKFLSTGEMINILRSLDNRQSIPFEVSIPEEGMTIQFLIQNIDFYLLECYQETPSMRDDRIEAYLSNFIVNNSLENQITDGSFRKAEDLFLTLLKKTADRCYFLTDWDLDNLVVWLVNAYNGKTDIFRTGIFDKGKRFKVILYTRPVFLHWLDIAEMVTKKK